ncbi:MAG: VCBS repeat-containing protein [Phycisphaerales bacterium]
MWRMAVFVVLGLVASASAAMSDELASPVRLEAAGKVIDTDVGHAAPCVCDFDGDGVQDLLVGQFGDGLLWIYRNEGTNAEPKLAAGVKFKDGAKDGTVPHG